MSELPYPTIVSTRKRVPNFPPIRSADYRIAIIGEAPGEKEEDHNIPFVGASGEFLTNILRDVGIDRYACLLGNICQVRPPGNNINLFAWDSDEIQSGLATLTRDLDAFNPHLCVLLGNTPLRAARGGGKITSWRGSLFRGSVVPGPFAGRKCIPSLHPAGVLRDFAGYPLLKFDLKRALDEGRSPDLILPQRELITNASGPTLCHILDSWPAGLRCSIDIEGYINNWPCVSVCARPTKSWTIVWSRLDVYWHARVLQSFARLMERRDVPKVLQNQLSDNFKLSWGHGILIRNVVEDTMIKGWEIYAELPRALEVQASIYTREPHWKDESMYVERGEGLYRGCAIDTAVTLEICNAQDAYLSGRQLEHYRTMIDMENPFHYMQHRGIRYDSQSAASRLATVQAEIRPLGDRLALEVGVDLRGPKGSLSAKKLVNALYETKKFPPQFKKEKGKKTDKLTSDIEALLALKKIKPHEPFLDDVLRHRHLEGVRETLQVKSNDDGRVRCAYSLEAETGRVKCYTSDSGSGTNLQTVQSSLRTNYTADPGYDFAQCDLEGADGWTVAAHCARLGDRRMLDDYLAGMKPAKIIALLYWFGPVINELAREDLKWLHDNVFPIVSKLAGKWLYMGCKRVQHGSNYLMGIPTMQFNVLRDSFKESGTPVYLTWDQAQSLQSCYFSRYFGVKLWHNWAEQTLISTGELVSASGHRRVFFGRRFGDKSGVRETLKQFLAHEPQNNTTWATNLAMLKLWKDPENRRPDGSLVIEPLHQVHDALCVQWPKGCRDWARRKVRSYFDNVLTIAGIEIKIPFDGKWGPSWGELPNPL